MDFIHPEPFKADVAIDIDDVIEKKMDMYHQHTSQMYEWLPFNQGVLDQVPASDADRRAWLGNKWKDRSNADAYREKLIEVVRTRKRFKNKVLRGIPGFGLWDKTDQRKLNLLLSFPEKVKRVLFPGDFLPKGHKG